MHLRLINLLLCKTFTIFQVSAGQTRAEQIRISQIGLTQPCAGQIRPHQIRISKIRISQIRIGQIQFSQVQPVFLRFFYFNLRRATGDDHLYDFPAIFTEFCFWILLWILIFFFHCWVVVQERAEETHNLQVVVSWMLTCQPRKSVNSTDPDRR